MSRIANPLVLDGDPINAAALNSRLSAFTQVGTLDDANVRSSAIDLPQFSATRFVAPRVATTAIGFNDYTHTAFNTAAGQTTGASPHIVSNSGGTPTVLSLGSGWQVTTADVLRVYFDLSVRTVWSGSRPWVGGALVYNFKKFDGTTNINVSNGHGCWAFWLQWDVTSSALVNWVNTPNQGDFNTVVTGTRGGNLLSNCGSTSVQSALEEYASRPVNGQFDNRVLPSFTPPGGGVEPGANWTAVDGAWHHVPSVNFTVYGLRVVFTGPLGAYHGADNYLVRNDAVAADVDLLYNGGQLNALLMRRS